MGIELSDSEDEDDTPHWSQIPAEEPESGGRRVKRGLWRFGWGALYVVDTVGEWLAWHLGITSPKFQYVIDEVASIQEEMDKEAKEETEALEAARAEADKMVDEMEAAGMDVDGGVDGDDYKGVDTGEPEGAPEDPAWAREVEVSAVDVVDAKAAGGNAIADRIAEAADAVGSDNFAASVVNTLAGNDADLQGVQNETNV